MTQKRYLLISLFFAFFGIQSINADYTDDQGRRIIWEGYALGSSMENFWQGVVTPNAPLILETEETYGLLYVAADDGGDGIYHDAGLNFHWIPDGENYIYYHYTPDFLDEGDKIRYTLEYDGFEILKTDNGIYLRSGWFDIENTTRVSFLIYQ